MNFFEMLNSYTADPNKIEKQLLRFLQVTYTDHCGLQSYTFKDCLGGMFSNSGFSKRFFSYEDVLSFISDEAKKEGEGNPSLISLLNLRYFLEFHLVLFDTVEQQLDENDEESERLANDIKRFTAIGTNGLEHLGYGICKDPTTGKRVTYRKDAIAENVAMNAEPKIGELIMGYLIAKGLDDKEKALTALCRSQEGTTPHDNGFAGQSKGFIQFLRHKDQYEKDPKYRDFFNPDNYEQNLDDLFHILIYRFAYLEYNPLYEKYVLKYFKGETPEGPKKVKNK